MKEKSDWPHVLEEKEPGPYTDPDRETEKNRSPKSELKTGKKIKRC